MKRRKHTPDQEVRKLREADRLLADGKDVSEVSKHLEVSEQTYHRWRKQYGGSRQTTPSASRNWPRRTGPTPSLRSRSSPVANC